MFDLNIDDVLGATGPENTRCLCALPIKPVYVSIAVPDRLMLCIYRPVLRFTAFFVTLRTASALAPKTIMMRIDVQLEFARQFDLYV